MPEAERRVPKATDYEARIAALENREEERDQTLKEIHAAVVGTAKDAGLAERIRALERFAKVITGAAYASALAVLAAWATFTGGPPRAHP
jgi:uncharacterized coiled-coil protein SlyX